MRMSSNNFALQIIESRSGNDRLDHCIDVLFESADFDYDVFLLTIELIVRETLKMKARAEQRERNILAQEAAVKKKELKKKSRAMMIAKNLSEVDKAFFEVSMNDPILSIALQRLK